MPAASAKAATQEYIDSATGSLVVKGILTGLYTYLLLRTIILAVPRLRKGLHIPLMVTLVILYILSIVNLAAAWAYNRSILVTNDETWITMLYAIMKNIGNPLSQATVATFNIAILIADMLMAWRCYMLWARNKWLLVVLGIPLISEAAFVILLIVVNEPDAAADSSCDFSRLLEVFTPIFNFSSVGITAVTTFLIVFRILTISRQASNTTRYRYIVDILVQSGMLYSSLNLIFGVTSIIESQGQSLPALAANMYAASLLQSMTGIAPTMIFERVITGAEVDEDRWSRPISILNFKKSARNVDTITDMHLDIDVEAPPDNVVDIREKCGESRDRDKIQHKPVLSLWHTEGEV